MATENRMENKSVLDRPTEILLVLPWPDIIEWSLRRGFLKRMGYWETHISQRTRHVYINVIFPKSRPPQHITLTEVNRLRTETLGRNALVPAPNGRSQVAWETAKPRLHENYIVRWEW